MSTSSPPQSQSPECEIHLDILSKRNIIPLTAKNEIKTIERTEKELIKKHKRCIYNQNVAYIGVDKKNRVGRLLS